MKKIGILTGGADCPGLNSVIRAVVRKSIDEGYVVTGVKNGWNGLVDNDMRILDYRITSGILDRGGTILGTSRLVPPLAKGKAKIITENFKRSGMDALIAIGGREGIGVSRGPADGGPIAQPTKGGGPFGIIVDIAVGVSPRQGGADDERGPADADVAGDRSTVEDGYRW